ncbi:hypothetical protein CTI12_AA216790 [Artemisia annua]|uniref:SHSP domain-containing protein n=1 Tax=Artemisia annua TaxID=35608 RepID=A0A2U1NXB2_ARTAN|nr:hypothetical protein CTI12_AA216790 [Artemisia annua]
MGALKQVLTTEASPAPTSWTWRIKTETTIHFGQKNQEPEKLDVTTKLSEEGLVIMIELAGFKEDNLTLAVEKNFLIVLGNAEISGNNKIIAEAVDIDPEHLFDAEKVTAELVDGYLKVTFPKGTKETMVTERYHIKWA